MVSGTRCPAWSAQLNQSPKGNMWSIIPIALLCMIVNLREGKQGSGPEGDEVLKNGYQNNKRTQRDFHSSCLIGNLRLQRIDLRHMGL